MDQLITLTESQKQTYEVGIYSDRLLPLGLQCPEDGTRMSASGSMYLDYHWMVEYVCPKCHERYKIWTPEVDAFTKQSAADVLAQTGN